MSLPRWRAIIRLFPLRGIGRITPLLVITAAAFSTTLSRFAPYIYRHQSITTTAIFLGVTAVIAYVLRRWYVERSTLSESEHYILLVMLAAYTSLVFGFLNYGLYRSNHRAFLVAKDFQESVFSENMAEVEGRIAASRGTLVFCEGLIKAFNEQPASSFDLIPKKRVFFGGLAEKIEYIAEAQIPNTVIRVTPVLGKFDSQVGAAAWHVEIEQSNNKIRLFPDEYPNIRPVVYSVLDRTLTRKQVNKADLVSALQSKADWERSNWLLPLQDLNMRDEEHLELPLSLFMYYAAMDALGSRPAYLTPMSFSTRTIALIYAFIKFLYFGIFISILSKQWSVSITQPSPKWWRHSRFNSGRRRRGRKT